MGKNEGMKTQTMLPLSQQVSAWLIQAMGLLDSQVVKISESTVKSAKRGTVVDRSWALLMRSAFAGFGVELHDGERVVQERLRAYDAKVSGLQDLGLPLEARLPAVLDVLIPAVGVRLGALAALLDGGVWTAATEAMPSLADRVAAPLVPGVFGDAVELAVAVWKPEWTTWSQRYEGIKEAGGPPKATVERWRGIRGAEPGKVIRPNSRAMDKFINAMPKSPHRTRVALVLRLARLSAQVQRDLSRWLGSQDAADRAIERVHRWARETRRALSDVECLAALAEMQVAAFQDEDGEALWAQVGPGLRVLIQVDNRADAVQWLDSAAKEGRERGVVGRLRMLMLQVLLAPPPAFVHVLRSKVDSPRPRSYELTDWALIVKSKWLQAALFRAITSGEMPCYERPDGVMVEARSPSPELKAWASRLEQTLDDTGEVSGLEWWTFLSRGLAEMGSAAELEGMGPLMADSHARQRCPREAEPMLPDEVVLAHPHLAIRRAARLADRGDTEWFRWWTAWSKTGRLTSRPWDERLDGASCIVEHAHRRLDGLEPLFDKAMWDQVLGQVDTLPDEHPLVDIVVDLSDLALQAARRTLDTLAGAFNACQRLLHYDPREHGAADAVAMLFPLAVRLVWLEDNVTVDEEDDDEDEEAGDSADIIIALAAEAQAVLERDKTSGPAWAVEATWHALTGGSPSFAERRARHYGAGDLLLGMRRKLRLDEGFDPKRPQT